MVLHGEENVVHASRRNSRDRLCCERGKAKESVERDDIKIQVALSLFPVTGNVWMSNQIVMLTWRRNVMEGTGQCLTDTVAYCREDGI